MSKTRIFVSSTCFDLSQVREDIRSLILKLGHEPLLSDYPSFPVLPELGAIENCKRNVRENTDIFVLIVGGRRGSLDPHTNQPVTNIEYETAKQHGIDTFIFVKQSVLTLLPVWEKNPNADFTPQVDYPEVFGFVKRIQTEQKWTFSFEKASEIATIFETQLSVFLKYLLDLKKEGKLRPLKEYAGESERAQQIALERLTYWEYLLTEELLRSKLGQVRRKYNEFQRGLLYKPSRRMRGREYFAWIRAKYTDLLSLVHVIKTAFTEEIVASWGAPGEPGDPIEIKLAVDKLTNGCEGMLDWELDFKTVDPPEAFDRLKELMSGYTFIYFDEVERIPEELSKPFKQPNPKGVFSINIVFKEHPNTREIEAELERVADNIGEWIEDY